MSRTFSLRATAILVVLALILAVSPIRAEALTGSTLFLLFGDDILGLIASICIGLGVTWTTLEAGRRAMDGAFDALMEHPEMWTDGGIEVIEYIGADGYRRSGVSLEMVEWVQTWLFDSGVVLEGAVDASFAYYNGVRLPALSTAQQSPEWAGATITCIQRTMYSSGWAYVLTNVYATDVYSNDGHLKRLNGSWLDADHWSNNGTTWEYAGTDRYSAQPQPALSTYLVWSSADIYTDDGTLYFGGSAPTDTEVIPGEDVALGVIAPPDVAIPDGYKQWASGAATVGDSVYYPVTLGPTLDNTLSQTQEQAWNGLLEYQIVGINCTFKSDSGDGAVYLGSSVTLSAQVMGVGTYPTAVEWVWHEGSGPLSSATTLTADGILTVGLDETATFLTAKAVSVADPTRFGTVTIPITLTEAPSIPNAPSDTDTFIGSLVDSISGLFTDSKTEAVTDGNAAVSTVVGAIPNYSTDFVKALQDFVGVMQYEGTTAVLKVPELRTPEIPGVVNGYVFLEEQEVDFEYHFQKMDEGLVLLVQSLLTIALIAYCAKEFYSVTEYVLTMRGGKRNE